MICTFSVICSFSALNAHFSNGSFNLQTYVIKYIWSTFMIVSKYKKETCLEKTQSSDLALKL